MSLNALMFVRIDLSKMFKTNKLPLSCCLWTLAIMDFVVVFFGQLGVTINQSFQNKTLLSFKASYLDNLCMH